MKQIALLPAGIHRLGNNVLHADNTRLFYRSTMAIYIINRITFAIEKILCANDRSIISVTYSPHDSNYLAMFGADGGLTVWSIKEEKILNRCSLPRDNKTILEWDPINPNFLVIISCAVGLRVHRWDVHKQAADFLELFGFADKSVETILAKWSPGTLNKLAVACNGARVYLFDMNFKNFVKLQSSEFPINTRIVDLQWDKLSAQYLLVAYDSFICLWDAQTHEQIQLFEKQNTSITSVAWLDWASGSFLSANEKTGILKLWNASQKTPLESFRVVVGGIQAIFPVPNSRWVLSACVDGSFNVFDVAHKTVEYKTSTSHSETIFNCAFSPSSSERFATCSYDGTLRIWKLSDLTLAQYLHADDGIIYSVCWSPRGNLIAGTTIAGTVIIWDVESAKEVSRYKHHTKSSFCAAWSPFEEKVLVSTSSDGTAVVFEISNEALEDNEVLGSNTKKKPIKTPMLTRFVHGAAVFGCAWSPFKRRVFCTGCQDGLVRVFDYGVSNAALYTLTGHSARVFNVVWSPIVPGLIASGSDDVSVIVWNIESSSSGDAGAVVKPKCSLYGHTSNVRALSWNYEHKDILLSGSWDRTIRIWDTVNATCIKVILDHAADVYALASHPARPFTYLSCSRDSTVRVWELDSLATHLKVISMLDGSFARIRDVAPEALEDVFSGESSPKEIGTPKEMGSPKGGYNTNEESDFGFDRSDSQSPKPRLPMTIAASPTSSPFAMTRKTPLTPIESKLPSLGATKKSAFSFPSFQSSATPVGTPVPESRKTPQEAKVPDDKIYAPLAQVVHGRESGRISVVLNKINESITGKESKWMCRLKCAQKYYNQFSLFSGSAACMDLWEASLFLIATYVTKEGEAAPNVAAMLLRPKAELRVTMEGEILAKARSDARKAESIKMMKRGALSNKNIEKLREAAMMNARVGDFERYCNVMIELGEWTAAMAMAPRVSMDFWNSLCVKYSEYLLEQSNEECVPYLMASGRSEKAVDYYLSRRDTTSGIIVAKAAEVIPCLTYGPPVESKEDNGASTTSLMQRVVLNLARANVEMGDSISAAAQFIASAGDFDSAIEILSACYQYDLAYALAVCFDVDTQPYIEKLAYKCARLGLVSVAIELLMKCGATPVDVSLLVSYACKTAVQAAIFINAHNLKSIEYWVSKSSESDAEDAVEEAVASLACARKFTAAAEAAISFLKKLLRQPIDADVRTKSVLRSLKHLQITEVDMEIRSSTLAMLFWYCSFEAAREGQYEVAWCIMHILRSSGAGNIIGLSAADITLQELLYRIAGGDRSVQSLLKMVFVLSTSSAHAPGLSAALMSHVKAVETAIFQYFEKADPTVPESESETWGPSTAQIFREAQKLSDVAALPSFWSYQHVSTQRFKRIAQGSTLPSASIASSSSYSYITSKQIQGQAVPLEDGITVISLNEALAWMDILPFSPLMTGERITLS